jgi:hypothetical protein
MVPSVTGCTVLLYQSLSEQEKSLAIAAFYRGGSRCFPAVISPLDFLGSGTLVVRVLQVNNIARHEDEMAWWHG